MSKSKAEKLTEKEKEQQRLVIPFDEGKQFVTNLNTLFEASPVFRNWEINHKSMVLKSNSLKMQFILKETAIEKIIDKMDIGQKRMGEFLDPDKVPDEAIKVEPD